MKIWLFWVVTVRIGDFTNPLSDLTGPLDLMGLYIAELVGFTYHFKSNRYIKLF